jgi:hypothetical protein
MRMKIIKAEKQIRTLMKTKPACSLNGVITLNLRSRKERIGVQQLQRNNPGVCYIFSFHKRQVACSCYSSKLG